MGAVFCFVVFARALYKSTFYSVYQLAICFVCLLLLLTVIFLFVCVFSSFICWLVGVFCFCVVFLFCLLILCYGLIASRDSKMAAFRVSSIVCSIAAVVLLSRWQYWAYCLSYSSFCSLLSFFRNTWRTACMFYEYDTLSCFILVSYSVLILFCSLFVNVRQLKLSGYPVLGLQ